MAARDRRSRSRTTPQAVARAFTSKQVIRYETLVASATDELLASLPGTSRCDIVEAFTNRLPIRVIADILGLPPERRDWLHLASRAVGAMLDATAPFDPPTVSQRFDELDTEFRQLIGQRRAGPGPDLVSAVRKGQNIAVMVGAANRDRRRWPDADQLRLDRPNPSPISFGFGARYCLGAALARMQLRIAIPALLNELGDYSIDHSHVSWKRSFTLRGPLTLPITR